MREPILLNPVLSHTFNKQAKTLNIGGITAFTATDYPGKLASVLFVQGCPWRCAYCQNPHLQERKPADAAANIPWEQIMALLQRRIGLIDAVVFSGGEPTMDPALPHAINEVKQLGFQIGLHTACIYPRQLRDILPLVDWVGFDIKTGFDDYEAITGIPHSGRQVSDCLNAIIASGVEYECRTTIHPSLHPETQLIALAHSLAQRGVKNYVWQLFRAQGCTNSKLPTSPLGYPSLETICLVTGLFSTFSLRHAN